MNLNYVLIRFFQSLLIIFIAVTINFVIPRMIPGDPIEAALSTKMLFLVRSALMLKKWQRFTGKNWIRSALFNPVYKLSQRPCYIQFGCITCKFS